MRPRVRMSFVAALSVAAVIVPIHAVAQAWPTRAVRMIVPFPPGNSADIVARSLADKLAQQLGQPFIVENRAGAGGTIGVEAVTRAAPDGYTLAFTSLSPVSIAPAVARKLSYDPIRELQPIAMVAEAALLLVATRSFPANTVPELVAVVKANPGKYSYASNGPGTISQLVMEALKAAAGLDIVEIGYKGSVQGQTDLLAGVVQLQFDGAGSAVPQVRAGKLKALASATARRSQIAPDVPTLRESGVPGLADFAAIGWIGALAPAGTPAPVVQRLHAELAKLMQTDEVRKRLNGVGLEASETLGPEAFADFIRKDLDRWIAVVKTARIEPQ